MSGSVATEPRSPLLHPLAIGALVALVVNDHLLKSLWPGVVTGKISDVAALLIVPPLAVELVGATRRGGLAPRGRTLVAVAAAVAVGAWFVAVKLHPAANEAYAIVMGLVQWPGATLASLLAGLPPPPPGRAPTVLDPGDLVALPAVALGSWIGAGCPTPRDAGSRNVRAVPASALRVGLAVAALFALAATSQAPPVHITEVARDEVLLAPGDPPESRRLTVRLRPGTTAYAGSDADRPLQIVVEARARWPFVEPPAGFSLARAGEDPPAPGAVSRLSVDPAACGEECTLDVEVAVDWPAPPDRPRSSVAWELVVTMRSIGGYVSGFIDIEGEGLVDRSSPANAGWLLALLLLPAGAILIGDRLRRRAPVPPRGVATAGDAVVLACAGVLASGLVLLPVLVPDAGLEPAALGFGRVVLLGGVGFGIAVVVGLVRWWLGAGELLAIVVLAGLFLGLLVGARLIASASETFAARGLQLATVGTGLAGVALAGAVARRSPGREPPQPTPNAVRTPPVGTARLVVAAILVALTVGLGPFLPWLAALLGFGVAIWWAGRGHLLGVASIVAGSVLAVLLLMRGPVLFGGVTWNEIDEVSLWAGGIAAAIGLFAALGVMARHPERPPGGHPKAVPEFGPPLR